MLFDVIYCYCCCSCCLTCCFLFTINDCGEWWCIFQWPPWRWDGLCYLYVGLFQTCSKCVHHHETLFLLKLCCGVIIHLRILGSHAIAAKGFVSLWQHHGDCSPAFESHWSRRRWLSYPRWIQGYFGCVGPTANHASDPEPRPFFHEFQHPRRFLQQGKKKYMLCPLDPCGMLSVSMSASGWRQHMKSSIWLCRSKSLGRPRRAWL